MADTSVEILDKSNRLQSLPTRSGVGGILCWCPFAVGLAAFVKVVGRQGEDDLPCQGVGKGDCRSGSCICIGETAVCALGNGLIGCCCTESWGRGYHP